jgi:hypothetical protein
VLKTKRKTYLESQNRVEEEVGTRTSEAVLL